MFGFIVKLSQLLIIARTISPIFLAMSISVVTLVKVWTANSQNLTPYQIETPFRPDVLVQPHLSDAINFAQPNLCRTLTIRPFSLNSSCQTPPCFCYLLGPTTDSPTRSPPSIFVILHCRIYFVEDPVSAYSIELFFTHSTKVPSNIPNPTVHVSTIGSPYTGLTSSGFHQLDAHWLVRLSSSNDHT